MKYFSYLVLFSLNKVYLIMPSKEKFGGSRQFRLETNKDKHHEKDVLARHR